MAAETEQAVGRLLQRAPRESSRARSTTTATRQNTKSNINGVWKKWMRYCRRLGLHATASLHSVQVLRAYPRRPRCLTQAHDVKDCKTFFRWTLDHYPGIKKKSSLHQYFRLFKMLYEKYTERWMDANTVKTLNSVSVPSRERRRTNKDGAVSQRSFKQGVQTYGCCSNETSHVGRRPHPGLASPLGLDTSTFADERQRVQLSMLSRPAKMMDHVDKEHLRSRATSATIDCPHPVCKEGSVVLHGLQHFKSHVEREHGIRHRA